MARRRALMAPMLAYLALTACADLSLTAEDGVMEMDTGAGAEDASQAAVNVRIDILPPYGVEDRTGATITLDAQSFLVAAREPGELVLQRNIELAGTLSSITTTPFSPAASVPGELQGVAAQLSFRTLEGHTSRLSAADSEGIFSLATIPGEYQVTVIPDDPLAPAAQLTTPELVENGELSLEVLDSYPVWGTITQPGGLPLPRSSVRLVTADGTAGPLVETDENGNYVLYANAGEWVVETLGRDNGRDPTIRSTVFTLDGSGLRQDFSYGELSLVNLGGRAIRDSGAGVGGSTLRLQAVTLDGYVGLDTSLLIEVPMDGSGNFDVRVVPGDYQVDILPPAETALTPASLGVVNVSVDQDVGDINLPRFRTVSGIILAPSGEPVPGATVRATEEGFDKRYFTTVANELGSFSVELPATDLELEVTPPVDRTDLAITRTRIGASEVDTGEGITMSEGQTILGQALWTDGDSAFPLPFALSQVYGEDGQFLGQALSDANGIFELQVDLEAYGVTR